MNLKTFLLAMPVWCAAQVAWPAEPAAPSTGIANCQVTTPAGDYAVVTLELTFKPTYKDGGRNPLKWIHVGGLRNGVMRLDDGIGLREPVGTLQLKDGRLTGRFRRIEGPRKGEVKIDATVKDGVILGTGEFAGDPAAVTGTIVPETEIAKINAIPKDKGWPSAQGPAMGGCSSEPTGVATIDDASEIQLRWHCEEIDIGRGMGNITRFMQTYACASGLRAGSGCASPLVAEGRLYLKYFVPAPFDPKLVSAKNLLPPKDSKPMSDAEAGQYETETLKGILDDARKNFKFAGDALPTYVKEKGYITSDDIVVCMDAATGKTLWKAVVKGRGVNSQHHKGGPFDMSPACGNGNVFALGMSGWIYAFDAATGKPIWETKAACDFSNALLVCGRVLVGPDASGAWAGYDVETGKRLWTYGERNVSTYSRWVHQGREYLIGRATVVRDDKKTASGVACLDAQTGKEVWTLPVSVLTGGRGLGPGGITISGDLMLLYVDTGAGAAYDPEKDNAPPQEGTAIAVYKLTPAARPELAWQVKGGAHGESVPVVVQKKFVFAADLRVLDLATGKALGQGKGMAPFNGGYMQAMEDLALTRGDGTHGRTEFGIFKIGPDGGVRSLVEPFWVPPVGGSTTSYHHPIFYALVDGRIFIRQGDGIYCWDLRMSPAMLKAKAVSRDGKAADGAVVDDLLKLCGDADPQVRRSAAIVLAQRLSAGRAADQKARILPALGAMSRDADAAVREAAGGALRALGADALEVFLANAADAKADVRRHAIRELGRLTAVQDPRIDQALDAGLGDRDTDVVMAALEAAQARGAAAASLAAKVAACLDSPEDYVARQAIDSLLAVSPRGQPPAKRPQRLVESLVLVLGLPNGEVAARATAMICGLGTEEAIRIFNGILKGDDALKGVRACNGLAMLGKAAVPSIPLIREAKIKWGGSRTFVRVADATLAAIEKSP
jgi:outer membrane protein assembly factor BamB